MSSSPKYRIKSKAELDSLDMIRCPYDSNHVMKKSKFEIHLSRCEKNMNPFERKQWNVCPFNYSHRIPVNDYFQHLFQCESNRIAFNYVPVNKQINADNHLKSMAINGMKIEKTEDKVQNEVIDEWNGEPNGKAYQPLSEITKAEDVFSENSFTDQTLLSRLSTSERKRLKAMQIDAINKKFKIKTIDKSEGLFTHINMKMCEEFHKYITPVNKVVMSKESKDSLICRSLRSIDISEIEKFEIKQIVDKEMRRPITNPFEHKLRRPFILKTEI